MADGECSWHTSLQQQKAVSYDCVPPSDVTRTGHVTRIHIRGRILTLWLRGRMTRFVSSASLSGCAGKNVPQEKTCRWTVFLLSLKSSLNKHNCLFININQLDALNFIISLFQASTCFEHMCSSSGGQIVLYSLWYHHTYRWPSGAQIKRGLDGMHGIPSSPAK